MKYSSQIVRLLLVAVIGGISILTWSCASEPWVGRGQVCIYIPQYLEFKNETMLKAFLAALDKFSPAGDLYFIKVHRKGQDNDELHGKLKDFCCTPKKAPKHHVLWGSVQVTQFINARTSRSAEANDALDKVLEALK